MPSQVFKKEGYEISDLDTAGSPKYYGFLDEIGNWYIIQMYDTAVRYVRGSSADSYPTMWANRATLSYDYFNVTFRIK